VVVLELICGSVLDLCVQLHLSPNWLEFLTDSSTAGLTVKGLSTWERKILRKVYGPVTEKVVGSNQELGEFYNNPEVSGY
jgi:hypothetical protein